jgi:hypothetical protein
MADDERRARLDSLTEAIRAAAGIRPRKCRDCGQTKPMSPARLYCLDCGARRQAEANRANQRRRRQWQTTKRQLAAGMLHKGAAPILEYRHIPCAHCGEPFFPRRASGRFCSTRCRVAAHRAKQGGLTG